MTRFHSDHGTATELAQTLFSIFLRCCETSAARCDRMANRGPWFLGQDLMHVPPVCTNIRVAGFQFSHLATTGRRGWKASIVIISGFWKAINACLSGSCCLCLCVLSSGLDNRGGLNVRSSPFSASSVSLRFT